jgi:hypothetical protein
MEERETSVPSRQESLRDHLHPPILFIRYLCPLFYELTIRHPYSWTPSYIDNVAIIA